MAVAAAARTDPLEKARAVTDTLGQTIPAKLADGPEVEKGTASEIVETVDQSVARKTGREKRFVCGRWERCVKRIGGVE
jgi:hypothetical protein